MSKLPEPEPEPTRPTFKMLLVVVAAILIGEAAYNWSDISVWAHVPEIEHMLGFD